MALLRDELGKRRWSGGGLVLLVLLCPLLFWPLLANRDINHPLSSVLSVDLCPLLPEPPPLQNAKWQLPVTGSNPSICEFHGTDSDAHLTVMLTTTRQLSVGGAQRTSKFFETWMKEVVVSGATDAHDQPGDWAAASSYRTGVDNAVLVEDHGVMLYMVSNQIDSETLVSYARAVTGKLR
jgi:hypothetical protein